MKSLKPITLMIFAALFATSAFANSKPEDKGVRCQVIVQRGTPATGTTSREYLKEFDAGKNSYDLKATEDFSLHLGIFSKANGSYRVAPMLYGKASGKIVDSVDGYMALDGNCRKVYLNLSPQQPEGAEALRIQFVCELI